MTFRFALFVLPALFLLSCSSEKKENELAAVSQLSADSVAAENKLYSADCKKLKREAQRMDSILLSQNELDETAARKAIVAFTEFGSYCENDTTAPIYLIKTAQVARAINNIPQAKTALDQCIAGYPNFGDKAAAIFLLAQLYDEPNYLNDEHQARTLYQKIIDEYPKSPWTSSAKGAILFLGKSDKQIMDELKKKQR